MTPITSKKEVSIPGKKGRKNSLQGSILRLDSLVRNSPLLLFPKGLMNLSVKHGRDSRLCYEGAQTIVLMMFHNYISSIVV